MRRAVTKKLRFPKQWRESRARNWFGSVGRRSAAPERTRRSRVPGAMPWLTRSGEIYAIGPQPDTPVRNLEPRRVTLGAGSRWRLALSRTPAAVRVAALSAVAIGLATLALPATLAGASGSGHSLRADLVARAGGHASFSAAGTAGAFFGTAPGHPAARPAGVTSHDSPSAAATAWLRRYGPAFGVRDAAHDLRAEGVTQSRAGNVVRLQQTVSGLPVVGGEMSVLLDGSNNLVSVIGHVSAATAAPISPAVSAATAKALAVRAVAKRRHDARRLTAYGAGPVTSRPERARWAGHHGAAPGMGDDGDVSRPPGPAQRLRRGVARRHRAGPRRQPAGESHRVPAGGLQRVAQQQRSRTRPARARTRRSCPRLGRRVTSTCRCLPLRRRRRRLLLDPPRPQQSRRKGDAAQLDDPLLRHQRPGPERLPASQRVLGRARDGLRRRLLRRRWTWSATR